MTKDCHLLSTFDLMLMIGLFFQAVDVIRQSGNVVVFTVQSLIAFEGGSSAADESTQQV